MLNRARPPTSSKRVPFFRVSNVQQSLRFHVDRLGFTMTKKWIDEERSAGAGLSLNAAFRHSRNLAGLLALTRFRKTLPQNRSTISN